MILLIKRSKYISILSMIHKLQNYPIVTTDHPKAKDQFLKGIKTIQQSHKSKTILYVVRQGSTKQTARQKINTLSLVPTFNINSVSKQ